MKQKFDNVELETAVLIPYVNNSRLHSEDQVKEIAASIKEFGFTNPVIVDEENGIIAGHGRVMAAELLKRKKVPCVRVTGWTEAQKKAYVIADNQLPLNAEWDLDTLRLEVSSLGELGFELDLLGFSDDVLKQLTDIEADFPELPDGGKDPFQQKTFTVHDNQASVIEAALEKANKDPMLDSSLNENKNGNAISHICAEWLRLKAAAE